MKKYANVEEQVRAHDADAEMPQHTVVWEACGGGEHMPPRHDPKCRSNVSLRSGPTQISLYCDARLNDQDYQGRRQIGEKTKSPLDMIPPAPTSVHQTESACAVADEAKQKNKETARKLKKFATKILSRVDRRSARKEQVEELNFKHKENVFKKLIND